MLTSAERRGALVLIVLLLIGAGHDLWRCLRARPAAGPVSLAPATPGAGVGSFAADTAAAPALSAAARPAGGSAPRAGKTQAPVDLNRASVPELESLPGIGPTLAGRIAEQRRRYGRFRELEDLLAVRGVGPRLLERLRPWARVTAVAGGAADSLAAAPARQ